MSSEALVTALLAAVVGALLAGLAVAAVMRRQVKAEHARAAELAAAVVKLGHDLRGALSPVLLMSERLEANVDPSLRQTGEILAKTVARATEITKAASAVARDREPRL